MAEPVGQLRHFLGLVVFVQALQAPTSRQVEVREEAAGTACVFSEDHVDRSKDIPRPRRKITESTDRRRHDPQRSRVCTHAASVLRVVGISDAVH